MNVLATTIRPRPRRSSVQLRSALWPLLWVAVLLALLAAPGYLDPGRVDQAVTVFGLVAIAQAWNIVAGFGGQVSLGVGAFAGTGGYTATLLMIHADVALLPAMGLAAVAGGLLAAVVSPAVFRLRGPYFTVGTLGLALAVQAWMQNWSFSGGTQPLSLPFALVPFEDALYRIALAVATVAMVAAWAVRRSDFGLRLMAVRDNEQAAGSLGVSAFRVKSAAFVISGAITALAGSLVAAQSASVEAGSAFGLAFTVNAVVMTVVGGIGTLIGPVVGVLVIFYGIQQQLQGSAELSQLLTGALLLAIVRFAPEGVWSAVRRRVVGAREAV
jgi:branched-chain amino acid transport system permease protein